MACLPFEEKDFLGQRLRELRLYFGFTQGDIAKTLNVSRSTYSYYEEGKTRPDPAVLGKLAMYYNIPVDTFYSEVSCVNVPLSDPAGRRHRTARTSLQDPQKIGDLRPIERSLILFLRSNGVFSTKDVLESLEYQLDKKLKEENDGGDVS